MLYFLPQFGSAVPSAARPMCRSRLLRYGLAVIPLVTACDRNRVTGPNVSGLDPLTIQRVIVQPDVDTVAVADTITAAARRQLKAAVVLKTGETVTNVAVAWSSSDPRVAVVDTAGLVTPRDTGTVRIRASASVAAEATVVVRYATARVTLAASASPVLQGDSLTLTARALDASGQPVGGVRYVFGSSDPARASVDSTGRVHVAAGADTGQVTFTVAGGGRTASTTVSVMRRAFAVSTSALPSAAGIVAAGDFTCGRLAVRGTYCWGRNDSTQLGTVIRDTVCVDDIADPTRPSIACALAPARQGAGPALVQLAAGGAHACGLDAGGAAYCWGASSIGQTGTGKRVAAVAQATPVSTSLRFASISAGRAHTCALDVGGSAYCWGEDFAGQLGDERRLASTTPIPVGGGHTFTQITAGLNHTCALDAAGRAYCWGAGRSGQLGQNTRALADTPVVVTGGLTFVRLSAGGISPQDLAPAVGDTTRGATYAPDLFGTDPGPADTLNAVTCGVTTSHDAYCWGAGVRGQLGNGSNTSSLVPVLVAGGGGYTDVSVGGSHVCALRNGEAVCWGAYDLGLQPSVGIGNAPFRVMPGTTFATISSGRRHACATTPNGDGYCWGSNVFGPFGDGLQALIRRAPARVLTPP
ncbi:hypothetical protein tb265_15990 [Gemmatimonadetes bacterium T265]|nr:hypothetical protein tb265_15990 [Gemmatimonadetes bacterium T265]